MVQTNARNSELTRRLWGKLYASHAEIANFPEQTGLQKRAKAYLLNGGKVGSGYGFLLK